MADIRRASLIPLLLAGCAPAGGAAPQETPPGLVLTVPAGPGSLAIANTETRPVDIAVPIAVETRGADGWTPIATEFNAVASCAVSPPRAPVRIAAGTTMTVVRWRGFSCSGQCEDICRGNIPSGPGPFRFVVSRLSATGRATRVVGPVFRMPPPGTR